MLSALGKNKKYTYRDYLQWPDEIKCEIINGFIYDMTPAPSRIHQHISMELSRQFSNFLKDKKCRIYAAPFDVRLPELSERNDQITTVIQPDIVVVCDEKKLDDKGCKGAPDLIIEIISPETASKDMKDKFSLFEKHGVKEYWIVYPEEKTVQVFLVGKDRNYKKPLIYSSEDKINVKTLKDLIVELKDVFLY